MKKAFLIFILIFFMLNLNAQTKYGQTPANPVILCGNSTYIQDSISLDSGRIIINPYCQDGINYITKNAFWYKIDCFQTGTFGFMITPKIISEDYDWEIFDITNRNPNDLYTDSTMIVAFNWSGVTGSTGTNANATDSNSCASAADTSNGQITTPNITRMPLFFKGHTYLLMVSHYTNTQYGYTLNLTGGTAGLNTLPDLGNTIYTTNSNFTATLSVSGYTPNAVGFIYQWEQGNLGGVNYFDIGGAFSPTYTFFNTSSNDSICYWLSLTCGNVKSTSTVYCNVIKKGSPSLSIDKVDTTTCAVSVNVPVRGKSLYNISTLKGSIHWDTAYLNLGGIKFDSIYLKMNFTQIDVTQAANGYLTYNWSDSIGHTVADSAPLFTMVMYPKPNVSGGTGIWFDSIPNKLEIDTAINVAAVNSSFNNGWIILTDTPQIIQNANILTCFAGCLPMHYQWYVNGNPIQFDTLNYIYPTTNGVYTCVVTYRTGVSISSTPVNVVLPVTLLSFKVQGQKLFNTINWQTTTETNTSHFNIQRSTNVKDFSTIGKVNAKGASTYTFNDPLTTDDSRFTKLYYRLQIVDKDGAISYSEVRELSISNSQFSITPNPAKDNVTVSGTNLKQVKLLDNLGRVVVVKEVANSNSISIPVSHITKGIYMVQATFKDGSVKTEKVVVE